jgi:Fur family ferric uptake transcriptional regulator
MLVDNESENQFHNAPTDGSLGRDGDSTYCVGDRAEVDTIRQALSSMGVRVTSQRLAIARALLEAPDHVTAEELRETLAGRGMRIGLATVYRTLNLLCECDLAARRRFGADTFRFEPIHRRRHHDHLVCVQCGKVTEFERPEIEELQQKVFAENDFRVHSHRLELYGICGPCQERPGRAKRAIS